MDFILQLRRSHNNGDDVRDWGFGNEVDNSISSSLDSNEVLTGMDVNDDYSDPESEQNDLCMSSSASIDDMQIDEDEDCEDFMYQLCERMYFNLSGVNCSK
jgi:hypothetical protein